MGKKIRAYRKHIDDLLAASKEGEDADWENVLKTHLTEISFFQHERLIHLMVTLAFALFELIAVIWVLVRCSYGPIALCSLLFILLIPYIYHYYILENEVQKMYDQYDEIRAKTLC